jgi:hypothetical protein
MGKQKKSIEIVTVELELKTKRGRPVDPGSARQQRLALMAERREAGELKRCRPTDPTSKRQQKLQLRSVSTGKRGRPTNPNSVRQQKLAVKAVA